jgi:hypothetical protein
MTNRNFERELHHYVYRDMENGDDVETIDYRSLAYILEEFCDRIEKLERELEYQKEYAMEQNERYG